MTEVGIERSGARLPSLSMGARSDVDVSTVALLDVIRSLAFVGDLAMGQPTVLGASLPTGVVVSEAFLVETGWLLEIA
jgi:hypothetical protein